MSTSPGSGSSGSSEQRRDDEWTIGRLLSWTSDYLGRQDLADARLASEVLLGHVLGCARIHLYARFEEVVSGDVRSRFREIVRRAAAREPIAYLVGTKEFFSLSFEVTPAVLVPRPETETLVEAAIEWLRSAGVSSPALWDLGTGSGCIAIAVLRQLPAARAVASDVSAEALAVALRNAERLGVADRLQLIEADGVNLPADAVPEGGFDALVSNPPYVPAADLAAVEPTVRDYEPAVALSDAGDGLSFYRRIAERASEYVRPGGAVLVEVGAGQAAAVREIIGGDPAWPVAATLRDRVEGHERVVRFGGQGPARSGEAAPEAGGQAAGPAPGGAGPMRMGFSGLSQLAG